MTSYWHAFRPMTVAFAAAGILVFPIAASAFQQAPSLDGQDLPPVDERLPASPEVVTPLNSVGTYGGTLRRVLGGSNDHNSILRIVSPQGFTRWNPDFSEVVPNVAESWTTNEDGSEFTFKLRAGMKWSDGQPLTADDVMFYVDDLLANKEFYPNPPARYVIDGQTMTAEKVNDHTVTLKFAASYGTFLTELATPLCRQRMDPCVSSYQDLLPC